MNVVQGFNCELLLLFTNYHTFLKGAICKNQKLLVHSDTCGRNVNESQRPVARARACARATLT